MSRYRGFNFIIIMQHIMNDENGFFEWNEITTPQEQMHIQDELNEVKDLLEGAALKDEAEQYAHQNPDLLAQFNPEKVVNMVERLSNHIIWPYKDDDSLKSATIYTCNL